MTTALTETMQASAQARQVLEELDEAAKLAQEAVEAVAPHSGVRNADAAEPAPAQASEADRIRLFIQRAARQRNQGREEMRRQYAATMVVEWELKIFDPHIASSVTRFLALVDAAKHWDEAIRLMCEMEFNACASESQIGEIRMRERRQFAGLNRLCASVVMGMSRRSHAGAARRSTLGANAVEGEGSTADGFFDAADDAADTSQKENPDSATT